MYLIYKCTVTTSPIAIPLHVTCPKPKQVFSTPLNEVKAVEYELDVFNAKFLPPTSKLFNIPFLASVLNPLKVTNPFILIADATNVAVLSVSSKSVEFVPDLTNQLNLSAV